MEDTHISELLAAYADGELGVEERARAEAHLAECSECRTELDAVRLGIEAVGVLPLVAAPDLIWKSIDAELARRQRRQFTTRALAIAAGLLVVAAGVWQWQRTAGPHWEVAGLPGVERVRAGEWMDTGSGAARVTIGTIGAVDVRSNSRVRMLAAKAGEQRLTLDRGEIHAKITAPPRLFFVETGAGTAIDLGCEYDLACDREGNGYLRVLQGWVSYERDGRESLVPAGASCRTRAGRVPDTPSFDDATAAFKVALEGFDANGQRLEALLSAARSKDTLTLWHLLSRAANDADRLRVFTRMLSFGPLPSGVSREAVLSLDKEALRKWREELAWTW